MAIKSNCCSLTLRESTWTLSLTSKEIPWAESSVTVSNKMERKLFFFSLIGILNICKSHSSENAVIPASSFSPRLLGSVLVWSRLCSHCFVCAGFPGRGHRNKDGSWQPSHKWTSVCSPESVRHKDGLWKAAADMWLGQTELASYTAALPGQAWMDSSLLIMF